MPDFTKLFEAVARSAKAEAALVEWLSTVERARPALEKLLDLARQRADLEAKQAQCVTDAAEIAAFFDASESRTECCDKSEGPWCDDCPQTLSGTLARLDARISKLEQGGVPIGRITVDVDGEQFKRRVEEVARSHARR